LRGLNVVELIKTPEATLKYTACTLLNTVVIASKNCYSPARVRPYFPYQPVTTIESLLNILSAYINACNKVCGFQAAVGPLAEMLLIF
jgi:hypothetical protein